MIFNTMLITGCGGDIALTLARIARKTGIARRLIGCDIHTDHAGIAFFDVCEVTPGANDSTYLNALERLIAKHDVDAVVPMSEAELARLLAAGSIQSFAGVPVVGANPLAVEIGLDKYATYQRLAARGLGVPWTRIVGQEPPRAFPCILKPRSGQGGKGLRIVENEIEAEFIAKSRTGDLWQEWLLPDDQEYTCGLYRDPMGETRTIILRRRLQGGLTSRAEVVVSAQIEALLYGVADVLELSGSINVQLRQTTNGPKVFEINPRFSSTVGFRHKLGFRDFIWSLHDRCGLAIETYHPPAPGTRMYRCANEIIIG
jgi:carbamoyl-phosphate synthase large subunit